ncbi:hypothetical protein D1AOALGA4SA_2795 [Olavius algarvensis Delta 1 endosymbiont]|nr:hypothetical protein D1AOALGA4SA_2795 [Olavius algarvensis Delta 1 endosymbiont]
MSGGRELRRYLLTLDTFGVVSKERQPLAASVQSDQRKETNERRTSNVE